MRAPVYRNLEARSTFVGLAFPTEWMGVLVAGWLGTVLGAPNVGAGAGLVLYLVPVIFFSMFNLTVPVGIAEPRTGAAAPVGCDDAPSQRRRPGVLPGSPLGPST